MNILKSTDLQSNLLKLLKSKPVIKDDTVSDILAEIVGQAHEVLRASACTIFIIDTDGQSATQRAGTGYQKQFVNQVSCCVIPADQVPENPSNKEKLGLTGWILSTGKPFLAQSQEELAKHPHRLGKHDPQQLPGQALRLSTFLGVPLLGLHGEIIGLIKAERREQIDKPIDPFSIQDQIALETIAQVTSKCREYLQTAQADKADAAMTTWARDIIQEAVATEGELDSFLDIVVKVTASAMGADSCGVYLIDESKKTLTQRAGSGSQAPREVIRSYKFPDRSQIETSKERIGLTSWIAVTGQSFYARNYKELHAHRHHRGQFDLYNFPHKEKTICGAFLGVPLQVGGTIIGVLKVENVSKIDEDDPREFSKAAQRRFDILAQDIALAIKRLQAHSSTRYEVIYKATPTLFKILRGGLEVPVLVNKVVTETGRLFNARACALFLKEGNQLIQPPWAAVGYAQKGPEIIRYYDLVEPSAIMDQPSSKEKVGLTVWIAIKQEKFTAKSNLELKMHPHHRGIFDPYNFDANQRCESFMGVPLLVGNKLVGVLKVETKKKQDEKGNEEFTYFTEQDELVFDLIANSAAIAIENARVSESQRLADQILHQRSHLLLDLHNFVKNRWQPVETLEQAANLLRSEQPKIADIMGNYAALLQPGFPTNQMIRFRRSVEESSDFLDESSAVIELYQAFDKALGVLTLPSISKFCSDRNILANPHWSKFFLTEAATILLDLNQRIATSLQGSIRGASLSSELIAHLIKAKEEAKKLAQPEQEIISRITEQWLDTVEKETKFQWVRNPYVVGLPIDPQAGSPFFGRQDVFEWIAENLCNAQQKSILVLYGEKRTGKTSILRQLEQGKLGESLRRGNDRQVYPILVNLQSIADIGTHLFLYKIADLICHNLIIQGKAPVPSIDVFEKAPYTVFEQFMSTISQLIAPSLLVLMIDEFERLEVLVAEGKVEKDIFPYLRHLMQFLPNITFILTGGPTLSEMSAEYNSISNIALHREISFMERVDAEKLIRDPVAPLVTYDDLAVDKLWRLTHGHPYFIQLICFTLINKINSQAQSNYVTITEVDRVVEDVLKNNNVHLQWLWGESSTTEQHILGIIANMVTADHDFVTRREITNYLLSRHFPEVELTSSLAKLIDRQLIETDHQHPSTVNEVCYSYTFDLLRLWISRRHPLATE